MNRIVKSSLLSLLLALCVLALAACQSAPAVTSIEVTTQPAKTEYRLGEELTLEGGQLTVSYSDKTTQTVALTDEGVTVSTPNMQKAGRKSLTVNYGGMRCRLYVTVQPIVVSFEMNGVGTAPEALEPLEAPTHAFIGGSSGNLRQIVELLIDKNPDVRIVATAVTLETVGELTGLMNEFEFADVAELQVNKPRKVGRYHLSNAQNPVYIFTFQKKLPQE